jgi:hypothetical protein
MPLYVYNITGAPVVLAAGHPVRTIPRSAAAPTRGPAVDCTSELRPDVTVDPINGVAGGLLGADYVLLQGQAASLAFEWTSDTEFLTPGLTVPTPGGSDVAAHAALLTGVHGVAVGNIGDGAALNQLAMLKKKIVNVDAGRVDVYAEDGSVERPYQTIAAALAVVAAGDTIHVFPTLAAYVEDVTMPAGVSMEGGGCVGAYTVIRGDFVTSAGGGVTLKNIHFGLNAGVGSLTINSSGCDIRECFCDGPIVDNSANPVTMFNMTAANLVAGTSALIANGPGAIECLFSNFSTTGDVPTIAHTAGWMMLSNCNVVGNRAGPVLDSTGGYVVVTADQVVNNGGGLAMDLTNGAASPPNVIASTIAVGNVDVTAAVTFIDNLVFMGPGVLVGENPLSTFHSPGMFIPTGAVGVVWAVAAPTNRSDAIDRIAAAVSAVHGPIA